MFLDSSRGLMPEIGMLCTYAGAIGIGVLSFGFTMKPMDT